MSPIQIYFDGFVGDVNLENRLQRAARNIPQPLQMRAYSTTSRSRNALRDSRCSRRTSLMSSTRSYATQTTNPNPPFGRIFTNRPYPDSFILIPLQAPKITPTKRHQKLLLSVSTRILWRFKPFLIMHRRQRLHRTRYETFPAVESAIAVSPNAPHPLSMFLEIA